MQYCIRCRETPKKFVEREKDASVSCFARRVARKQHRVRMNRKNSSRYTHTFRYKSRGHQSLYVAFYVRSFSFFLSLPSNEWRDRPIIGSHSDLAIERKIQAGERIVGTLSHPGHPLVIISRCSHTVLTLLNEKSLNEMDYLFSFCFFSSLSSSYSNDAAVLEYETIYEQFICCLKNSHENEEVWEKVGMEWSR